MGVLPTVALVLAIAGAGAVSVAKLDSNGCHYGGNYYQVGESFPDPYSCNTCFCGEGNSIACTKIYCPRCWYNGVKYQPGDSFTSIDGCNTCSCTYKGTVLCTKIGCLQLPDS